MNVVDFIHIFKQTLKIYNKNKLKCKAKYLKLIDLAMTYKLLAEEASIHSTVCNAVDITYVNLPLITDMDAKYIDYIKHIYTYNHITNIYNKMIRYLNNAYDYYNKGDYEYAMYLLQEAEALDVYKVYYVRTSFIRILHEAANTADFFKHTNNKIIKLESL